MQQSTSGTTALRLRRRIYEVIEAGRGEDTASRIFDFCIVALILANVAAYCLETVPEIEAAYGRWLDAFELVSVAIFTIEYALRIWIAVEVPFLSRLPPWRARLRFAQRPYQVFDLLAVLPFYVGTVIGIDLRILRLFRLLRLLKLTRYSPAMHTLLRVLQAESRPLAGALLLLMAVLLISATGMYLIEGKVQPDKFGSIPQSSYWAMTTLTTVGYGDIVPVTVLGKLWAMMTMLFGLCVLALPVAIISTGFAQEVGRRDFVLTWSLMSRIPMFAELDAEHVAELMPLLHAQSLPPNVEVIAKGSPGQTIYFIASGTVHRASDERPMLYRRGDFFGSTALLDNSVHSGRYVTRSRVRVLKLHRADFHRLESTNPAIASHIRRVSAARLEREG